MFKIDSITATQKEEQQDSIDIEIEAEIFARESLNAETKEDKVLNWLNLNKSK